MRALVLLLALAQFPGHTQRVYAPGGGATGANDPAAGWTSNGTTTSTTQNISAVTAGVALNGGSGALIMNNSIGNKLQYTSATKFEQDGVTNTFTGPVVISGGTSALTFNATTDRIVWSSGGNYINNNGATGFCRANTGFEAPVIKSSGFATGSLPSCGAAQEGNLVMDLTLHKLKFCNGTSYETVTSL